MWQAFCFWEARSYWDKHDVVWVPTLQLAKKYYRAKLGHDANAERAERAKKRYELARGQKRARIEACFLIGSCQRKRSTASCCKRWK